MNAPEAMAWLLAQLAPYGIRATITSGIRSSSDQARLYAQYVQGKSRYPVARPGTSKHEQGRAVDISASREVQEIVASYWKSWGGRWGGDWPGAQNDPVHYEF